MDLIPMFKHPNHGMDTDDENDEGTKEEEPISIDQCNKYASWGTATKSVISEQQTMWTHKLKRGLKYTKCRKQWTVQSMFKKIKDGSVDKSDNSSTHSSISSTF